MLRISTLKVVSDSKLYLEVFYTIFFKFGGVNNLLQFTIQYDINIHIIL